MLDPLENKASSLLSYCYPDTSIADQGREALRQILNVDNIQHFLQCYKHFHSHWPVIHLATFRIQDTTDALLLAMITVGAVYSDRLSKDQVRWLMEVVRIAVNRSAHVLRYQDENFDPTLADFGTTDLQELQAICLLQALFAWHGTKQHRNLARESVHPTVTRLMKRLKFHITFGYNDPRCSFLHEPGHLSERYQFSWAQWVEQEARIRTIYMIFLLDVAFVIFFNTPPQFDIFELRIPLPADDAAFEATDENECAIALGFHGVGAQEMKNITGSRRKKQIQLPEALKFLLQHPSNFAKRSTNAYSKFILIHALHIQIWNIQRQCARPQPGQDQGFGLPWMAFSQTASGASTPVSGYDWVASDGTLSTNNSGRATPTDAFAPSSAYPPQALQQLRMVTNAVEKWHHAWTKDTEEQYPQMPFNGIVPARDGFCRDAEHFYYLAKHFIHNTQPYEWQIESEQRMQQVFRILSQIKNAVANEQGKKGEQIGSVAKMDDTYAAGEDKNNAAVESITLDMRQLFTPVTRSQ